MKLSANKFPCAVCQGRNHSLVAVVDSPAHGETVLSTTGSSNFYHREVWRCLNCGHYRNYSAHQHTTETFYCGGYWNASYCGKHQERFAKILALPAKDSDNHQRCQRLRHCLPFWPDNNTTAVAPSLCDVGSGLGVFVATMQRHGWQCCAIDPDPRSTDHIAQLHQQFNPGCLPVQTITGLFPHPAILKQTTPPYSLVTAIKVLEHLENPAFFLRSLLALAKDGWLYLEVPDALAAAGVSVHTRQEFFSEHLQGFSDASFQQLMRTNGMHIVEQHAIAEPSGKYTLWALCKAE